MTFVWTPGWGEDQVDMALCRASVADGGRSMRVHQCSRKGVVKEDGVLWCRQHAPSAEATRREKRDRKWQLESDARGRTYARQNAHRAIADTAIKHFRQEATFDELEQAVMEYERLSDEGESGPTDHRREV